MAQRLILSGLFVSFLLCYLEWGENRSGFFFQLEYEIFVTSDHALNALTHPLVAFPLLGQLLLMYTAFQKKPGVKLAWAGIIMLSLLVFMVLLVGILGMNFKIILSTVPFVVLTTLFFLSTRKKPSTQQ